ncbi:MAG: trimeric autotransporter adhesin, partial [Actinomycetota bacterium]|nr:trimeric autotransporter adhesin [Actinomycetota bacterium]
MTVLGEAHLSADGGPLRWAKRLRTLGLVAVAAMLAGLFVSAGTSPAQAAPPAIIRDSPTANVTTIAEGSGVTYVAGGFTSVGAATGPGALVDSTVGVVDRRFLFVDYGSIFAVAADGAGGFYLGGSFTSLNGVPRNRLAHVAADGTLDPMWKPTVAGSTPTEVYALAVSGSTVYVGGSFTQVSGTTRNRAAAVDATTGTVMAWNPNIVVGAVYAMAVSGSTVYL